jgi:hypothetical protein
VARSENRLAVGRRTARGVVSVALLLAAAASPAPLAAATLYDAALGSLPSAQGWTFAGSGATQSVAGGSYTFDTTASNAGQAGNVRALSDNLLDTGAGFDLGIRLRVVSETHDGTNGPNRAGFSLLLVGDNPAYSLELAFWESEVWAYSYDAGFQKGAAQASIDTTGEFRDYLLSVQSNAYALYADGTALFGGPLQDYRAGISLANPATLIYGSSNTLFFGDDTTSARGLVEIQTVSLTSVPVPAALPLFASALLALPALRRRRQH